MEEKQQFTQPRRRMLIILITYALRLVGQGLAFLLFAKVLGAQNFGYVVASLAIYSPISPLVDMGAYSIVSRDISLGREPLKVISENLTLMIITLPLGLIISVLLAHALNPSLNITVVFLIGVAYLLISRNSLLLAAIQNTMTQRIPIIAVEASSALLLTALGTIGLKIHYSLLLWSCLYACIGITLTLASIILISSFVGRIQFNLWPNKKRIYEGLSFSFGSTFQYIYTDVDKSILLRYSSAATTGVYGMTSRIATILLIPIGAVYSLFYPRFMRSGHNLDIPINKLLQRVLIISSIYTIIVGFTILVLSHLVPLIIGPQYSNVPNLLKLLTGAIIFQIFQIPFADAITGMGHQNYRTVLQGVTCVVAITANLFFTPGDTTFGVVKANLVIHGTLLALYISTYFFVYKKFLKPKNILSSF